MSGAEVVVDGVAKAFEGGRIRALEDVSLRLEPGELVALTGPSGSGKSTLLNLIGSLDRPDAGSIVVDGRAVDSQDATGYRAGTVGFVFQAHNLIPVLSASENVQVAMIGRGPGRTERQRVAIARALANDPRLLLADEPTGALDSETSEQILALLLRLRESRGMTILLVTNDRGVAERADRIVELRDGRLLAPERLDRR